MNPCRICKIPTKKLLIDKIYHYCEACEYIFLDSEYFLSATEEKKVYSLHENSIENSGYVAMFERFLKPVLPLGTSGRDVLDFGCGPGPVLAQLLEQKGYKSSIYDPCFFPDTKVLQKRYDLIVSTEVFEHLSDPLRVTETIAGLCKPGGTIAVMTRHHDNDRNSFASWYYRNDPTHIGFFTRKTFAVLAKKCGLRLGYCDGREVAVMTKV